MINYPSLSTHLMVKATDIALSMYREKLERPETYDAPLSAFQGSAEAWMEALLQRWREEDA